MYLEHSIAMYVVQFEVISNIIRRRPAATIHQANNLSPLVCVLFCMASVGNDEFHESHEPTVINREKI